MLVVSASDSLKNGKLRQIWFALRVNTDSHRMRQLEVGAKQQFDRYFSSSRRNCTICVRLMNTLISQGLARPSMTSNILFKPQ